jgi:hypothetical protein
VSSNLPPSLLTLPLPPRVPPAVLSLVRDVFLHTKGEAGVAVVVAFLRRQCLTCLRWVFCAWVCFGGAPEGGPAAVQACS